jgi:uncharacterized membrane protein YhhN
MKKVTIVFFLIVSAGEIVSSLAHHEFLHMVCKPLIMIFLGAYYWLNVHPQDRSNVVMMAISFSFLGDTLLLFGDEGEVYFMGGLVAFLLAHLFYIFAYRQHRNENLHNALQSIQRLRLAFPIVLAGTGLLIILYPTLGSLRIPVIVYTIVILMMVLNALFRYGRTSRLSFWMVFGGAVLFMISDSILAINKFHSALFHAPILIMIPYITAQFLIVRGLIAHSLRH